MKTLWHDFEVAGCKGIYTLDWSSSMRWEPHLFQILKYKCGHSHRFASWWRTLLLPEILESILKTLG